MPEPTIGPLEATLRRLKTERDEADARYNAALTGVDRALTPPPALPDAHLALDDHQITPLNEHWNIGAAPPAFSGIRGRLARFVWRIVGPPLERQAALNSRLVDHVNRNAAAARESHRVAQETTVAIREQLAALAAFQSRLMVCLQQVTPYVDTKDRDSAAGALVLNAAQSGMAEDLAKRWEALGTRDLRRDARLSGLAAEVEELRGLVSLAQQSSLAIKRHLERADGAVTAAPVAAAGPQAFAPSLDAYKYVGFEDRFRGSPETIRARLESYLPIFEQTADAAREVSGEVLDVLDIGCGRGEFLDLLAARGISSRGIDLNHEMAEGCRARGLRVEEADAVGYLLTLPDASLRGIFAAQVVEHLPPAYLLRLLDLAHQKLRPGGRLVLETLNPACWVAFFESYIRDITHVWPLHPETLQYLTSASGFPRVRIEFRSPVPQQDRLQPIAVPEGDAALADLADTFNANVEKLNARMFTHMDYAVIGEKSAV